MAIQTPPWPRSGPTLPSRLRARPVPVWLPVGVCVLAVAAAVGVVAAEDTPVWSGPVTGATMVVAAVVAWRVGRRARAWAAVVAAALAGLGAAAGAGSDGWWAVALASAGLSVAAVVDVLERRIPTPVAHGTTAVSLMALVALALGSGRWGELGVAVGATALVTLIYAILWAVRAMGFADVRLAAATVSAGSAGTAYIGAMLFVPAVTLGVAGLVQLLVRRRITSLPFAPALVAGWLVALGSLPR